MPSTEKEVSSEMGKEGKAERGGGCGISGMLDKISRGYSGRMME